MLKKLKPYLKCEEIFDIVIYGSSVKGKTKPTDIDIMIIFESGSLKERLTKVQEIKRKVNGDIQQLLLKELFMSSNLARKGILMEGISIKTNKPFVENMGFKPCALFWYDLSNLTHTGKVKLTYILSGRGNKDGAIKRLNVKRLSRGSFKVPIKHSDEFEEILKHNKINYERKNILVA